MLTPSNVIRTVISAKTLTQFIPLCPAFVISELAVTAQLALVCRAGNFWPAMFRAYGKRCSLKATTNRNIEEAMIWHSFLKIDLPYPDIQTDRVNHTTYCWVSLCSSLAVRLSAEKKSAGGVNQICIKFRKLHCLNLRMLYHISWIHPKLTQNLKVSWFKLLNVISTSCKV